MPLYHVQDSDRPLWVLAGTFGAAVLKWKRLIAKENDDKMEDVADPQGVHFICDDDELIR